MGWTIEGVIVPETLSRPTRPMAARVWIFLPSDLMARLVLLKVRKVCPSSKGTWLIVCLRDHPQSHQLVSLGEDLCQSMLFFGPNDLVDYSLSASGGPSLSGRSWPLRQTRLVVMTWLVVVAKFVVSVGMAELATSISHAPIGYSLANHTMSESLGLASHDPDRVWPAMCLPGSGFLGETDSFLVLKVTFGQPTYAQTPLAIQAHLGSTYRLPWSAY
uniref:Uncharacterized protein n=1 Tax=Cannabis sativa TaxID=3483 RepID=A0A803PSM1_CANSA